MRNKTNLMLPETMSLRIGLENGRRNALGNFLNVRKIRRFDPLAQRNDAAVNKRPSPNRLDEMQTRPKNTDERFKERFVLAAPFNQTETEHREIGNADDI